MTKTSTPAPTKRTSRKLSVTPTPEFYLGGYDAKSCPTLVMKNFHPGYTEEDKDPFTPGAQARMQDGVEFEPKVGDLWAAALGSTLLVIPACDRSEKSKKLREKLTLQAMREPGDVTVIWNARLPKIKRTHQTGEPDALVRHSMVDGVWRWVPVDVKHHRSLSGDASPREWPISELGTPLVTDAVTDTSMGKGTPRKEDAMQLAHYHRMLEHLGHAAPESVGGIIGKEERILWHRLDAKMYDYRRSSALSLYDEEFASRVEIARAALSGERLVSPEKNPDCKECIWRTSCHDEMKVDLDHITLVFGITPKIAKMHYQVGVSRITDLAHMDWRTARLVDHKVDVPALMQWAATVPPETSVLTGPVSNKAREEGIIPVLGVTTAAEALKLCARTAQYATTGIENLAISIDRARSAKVGKVLLARGVTSVGINRSVYEQDLDIEDENGHVYLIGVRTTGRKRESGTTQTERHRAKDRFEYDAFVNWDHNEDGEAKVFVEFWEHVTRSREFAKRRGYAYRLYYYSHHEPKAFKTLAARHAGKPGVPTVGEVEEFFALKEIIDLHSVVASQMVWPTEDCGLKELAKWVRFSWRDSDPGGGNSLAWYKDAVQHPDESVREENRNRILEYNEDDVAAQVALRDWLSRLGEARYPGKKLPAASTLDRRFTRR